MTVYFIGAGPGAADLITVRGAQRLAQADVVLFDALTDPALRVYAPKARWIDVGKRGFADARRAGQRLHDANQLGRTEAALVLEEPRREVQHAERALGRLEARLEDVGVGQVSLYPQARRRRSDGELAAVVVEERPENRRRIEARHAAPDDGAVAPYMSCQLAVANEPEIRERHAWHV